MKQCKFEGCDRSVVSHGYCETHNRQRLRTGVLKPIRKKRYGCLESGCNEKHYAKGYCRFHYFSKKWETQYKHQYKPTRKQRKCVICGKKHVAKGLCNTHYYSYRYHKKTNGEKLDYYNSLIIE